MIATQAAEHSLTPDPSMEQLAPKPSRVRNRSLLFVAVVVLIAALFSPSVLRPSVSRPNSGGGGSWIALPAHQQVMTTSVMTGQTWPSVDIHSIDDVLGAQLVDAWVVDESVLAAFDDTLDKASYESGLSYLNAALPGLDADGDALPQSIGKGDTAILIALWEIDNCEALDVTPTAPANVQLRTIIRTSATETLPEITAPGFDVGALRRVGVCG